MRGTHLLAAASLLVLLVLTGGLRVEAAATQQSVLTPSSAASYDRFAASVALTNTYAIAGAADRTVGSAERQGVVGVFQRSSTAWSQMSLLSASDGKAYDNFGHVVATTDTYAAVGAPRNDATASALQDSGAVYVYTLNAGAWALLSKLTASNAAATDAFGTALALNDGLLVVSAPEKNVGYLEGVGAVYAFTRGSTTAWTESAILTPADVLPGQMYGTAVAVGLGTSTTFAVGACGQGSYGVVYVFTKQAAGVTPTFAQQQKITPTTVAVGARFGSSLALSGSFLLVGAPLDTANTFAQAGSVVVYTFNGSTWVLQQTITASDAASGDNFGVSVSINAAASAALIGSRYAKIGTNFNQGASYLLARSASTWSLDTKMTATSGTANDEFSSVALADSYAVVGAPRRTVTGTPILTSAGTAFTFSVTIVQQATQSVGITRSRSKAKTRSRSKAKTRSRSKAKTRSRSKAKTRSRSKAKTRSRSKAKTRSRSKAKTRSRSKAKTRSRSKAKTRSRSKAKSRSRSKARTKSNKGSKSRTKARTYSKAPAPASSTSSMSTTTTAAIAGGAGAGVLAASAAVFFGFKKYRKPKNTDLEMQPTNSNQ